MDGQQVVEFNLILKRDGGKVVLLEIVEVLAAKFGAEGEVITADQLTIEGGFDIGLEDSPGPEAMFSENLTVGPDAFQRLHREKGKGVFA